MANERILVAEDDLKLRPMLCEYLRSEGYVTLEAGDGAQALQLWEEHCPDLIVLDWMLPAMSGLDVARQVRAAAARPSSCSPPATRSPTSSSSSRWAPTII